VTPVDESRSRARFHDRNTRTRSNRLRHRFGKERTGVNSRFGPSMGRKFNPAAWPRFPTARARRCGSIDSTSGLRNSGGTRRGWGQKFDASGHYRNTFSRTMQWPFLLRRSSKVQVNDYGGTCTFTNDLPAPSRTGGAQQECRPTRTTGSKVLRRRHNWHPPLAVPAPFYQVQRLALGGPQYLM
jgi:hypothetical protein